MLYLIEILHQTTTRSALRDCSWCCILSKFYIKPQPYWPSKADYAVVSYRNSTSNHNLHASITSSAALYLIEILHQTTTDRLPHARQTQLYLIEILHQTTTAALFFGTLECCILSKFYIKPQQLSLQRHPISVVSYRNSTSNHNFVALMNVCGTVVSYRNSTSNHNSSLTPLSASKVVSYRNSTSNHNRVGRNADAGRVVSYRNSTSNHNSHLISSSFLLLYLIEILHQTTTYKLQLII